MTRESDNEDLRTVSEPGEGEVQPADVPKIEGYEITGKLGEGGMGTVWRAVQLSTRREVALKLLGSAAFGSDKARMRFEREVELAARLEHPNVARVYDSGLYHGVYYYAMELIDGVHLDKHVEQNDLAPRQILELVKTVAEAVQHAHQRGVIHRDLKPSNILVTEDGQPHVVDFGLAKTFQEDDRGMTVSMDGDVAGTPAYMSPEQAAGHIDEIDTRTDVYSLGAILYRLLTGQFPHELSGTRYEVLRRIAEEEACRPREVSKEIDKDLLPLSGRPLGEVLLDESTDLRAVKAIKDYGKRLATRKDTEADHAAAIAIYYAAIASALLFHDERITSHGYEYLRASFEELAEEAWIPAELIRHFSKAQKMCEKKRE